MLILKNVRENIIQSNTFMLEEEEEEEEEEVKVGSSHSKEQSQSNGLGERRKVGGEARLDTCDDTPSRFSDV